MYRYILATFYIAQRIIKQTQKHIKPFSNRVLVKGILSLGVCRTEIIQEEHWAKSEMAIQRLKDQKPGRWHSLGRA